VLDGETGRQGMLSKPLPSVGARRPILAKERGVVK
jgi:hypothetical protein